VVLGGVVAGDAGCGSGMAAEGWWQWQLQGSRLASGRREEK